MEFMTVRPCRLCTTTAWAFVATEVQPSAAPSSTRTAGRATRARRSGAATEPARSAEPARSPSA
jgi:hypothetical protein